MPRDAKIAAHRFGSAWLLIAASMISACGKPAAPPTVATHPSQPAATTHSDSAPSMDMSAENFSQPSAVAIPASSELASASPAATSPDVPVAIVAALAPTTRVERLVLFTPRGPLIVQIEVDIDGEPQSIVVERTLKEALKAAEISVADDDDPSWSELMANSRFAGGQLGNLPAKTQVQRNETIRQFDFNSDGRVQRNELAALLTQNNAGGRAFSVQSINSYREHDKQDSSLFVLLDQDHDGRISAAEMSTTAERLVSRDADDDETITVADFRRQASGDPAMRRRRTSAPDQVIELQEFTSDSVYYALSELYDLGSGLDAASFALTPGLLDQLDLDHNGVLDQQEIAGMINARPDLRLKVNFGTTSSGQQLPAIELQGMSDDLTVAGARAHPAPGRLTIELSGLELDVFVDDRAIGSDPRTAAMAQFSLLDTDMNDFLEEPELVATGTATGLNFKELDNNSDGKLSLEEVTKSLSQLRSYSMLQVQARVGEVDDALFSWLDLTHDGRLTWREILGAAERLAELDQDGDCVVTAAEIPDRWECRILRAAGRQDGEPAAPVTPRRNQNPQALRWLTAMDQNADGEVSAREFLGTPEQFSQMDANGDGFIDASEAH